MCIAGNFTGLINREVKVRVRLLWSTRYDELPDLTAHIRDLTDISKILNGLNSEGHWKSQVPHA